MMQHPCNRFGFGLNAHQVNYAPSSGPQAPHQDTVNYSHMNGHAIAKPTNPWPTVPVSMPVNVSLPQHHQFNFGRVSSSANPSGGRDLPLTPPADRTDSAANAAAAAAANNNNAGSYYTMLPPMTNNNLMVNYSQSPIEKAMTPPQENQDARLGYNFHCLTSFPIHSIFL